MTDASRLRVGLTGLTVMRNNFRDQEHLDVLLFIDNIFRFVQAGSEVSALLGRMLPPLVTAEPQYGNRRTAGAHHIDEKGVDHFGAGDYVRRRLH